MIVLFAGGMMRNQVRITNELVVIALHTTHITCMWVQRVNKKYRLRAHRVYQCGNFQIGRTIIFNPSWISDKIDAFLTMYQLQHAFIAFMPDAASVTQGFVACATAHPHAQEFAPYRTRQTMHAYHYLYPRDDNRFIFYWYRIAHTLLMQYTCIMVQTVLNVIRITPRFCALLAAYQMVHALAFRPSQLALDMEKVGNRISRYFTDDIIKRCVYGLDDTIQDRELMLDALAACGLLWSEKEI